jgi:hypothetical protein
MSSWVQLTSPAPCVGPASEYLISPAIPVHPPGNISPGFPREHYSPRSPSISQQISGAIIRVGLSQLRHRFHIARHSRLPDLVTKTRGAQARIIFTLMMEAIISSESRVLTTAIWSNVPDDDIHHVKRYSQTISRGRFQVGILVFAEGTQKIYKYPL